MESENIREACLFCCYHCEQWNKRMATLAMDEIPPGLLDNGAHSGSKIIVTIAWPGWHTKNMHSLVLFLMWNRRERAIWHGCENSNLVPILSQPAAHFIDMRFCSAYVGIVAWSYHEYVHFSWRFQIEMILSLLLPLARGNSRHPALRSFSFSDLRLFPFPI